MPGRIERPLLLINVGTPVSAKVPEVSRYLKQFLTDPEIIPLPSLLRHLLVRAWIVPRRAPQSAEAYRQIWTKRGSPLAFHSEDLAQELQKIWPAKVTWAMRYGQPSIQNRLGEFSPKELQNLIVLPLYPQYSTSAWRSAAHTVRDFYRRKGLKPPDFLAPFHRHQEFRQCWKKTLKEEIQDFSPDHVLFSYHGLPKNQVQPLDQSGSHCMQRKSCCETLNANNQDCYRQQCFDLSHELAQSQGLEAQQYTVAFQSRLGRTPWIEPFTDQELQKLGQIGRKKLLVLCPSFVADCLETLEEIAIRGREIFVENGGDELKLAPSLNSRPDWVNALAIIAESGEYRMVEV